jgi:alpha-beta hydrolase superfamily lysophospholipase
MSSTTSPVNLSFASPGGVRVAAYRWEPAGTPVGIVQLTHGMGEHVRRYDYFAAALNSRGYLVYGQDHRGHGVTAATTGGLGHLGEHGWAELLGDIGRLSEVARAEHPGLPLALFGHSMGSFATQQYLLEHSDRVDAAILSGTAAIDLLEPGLNLDEPIDLSAFNAPFAPARTDYDWLSRDDEQVDRYVADPYCGFGLDLEAGKDMFTGARGVADPDRLGKVRADLPLYLMVGDADPVNGGLALFDPLEARYRAAGLTDVTRHVYPGARHEILNETNRNEVIADLLAWLPTALNLP